MNNNDQRVFWNEGAGAKWVDNQVRLDRLFAPLTEALLAAAALRPGERVWDIGCGCGDVSLALARQGGLVRGVDLSRPMLDHARARAHGAVEFIEADAATYPFAPEASLLISRFGTMFFAEPLAAFTHLRRALRPGGRLAWLCWQKRSRVEWMQWPLDEIASMFPPPPETMGQPGPFGLADERATLDLLAAAGFADVTASAVTPALTIGEAPDAIADALALILETGPAAALLREADPGRRVEAVHLLQTALEAKVSAGRIKLGGACWLYQGVAR